METFPRSGREGRLYKAVKEGFVQNQVNASAETRHMNVARRKEILLGTNQYPNFNEVSQRIKSLTAKRAVADAESTREDIIANLSSPC